MNLFQCVLVTLIFVVNVAAEDTEKFPTPHVGPMLRKH